MRSLSRIDRLRPVMSRNRATKTLTEQAIGQPPGLAVINNQINAKKLELFASGA